jgi:hypothetical protein
MAVDNSYSIGVSEDALNLKDMLDGVVERVENVFTSYNVPLPNRRYWTMGTPVIDCDQLVISFTQMFLGTPGIELSQPQRCNVPRSATLLISIARQFPVVGVNGRPPSGEKIQEASAQSAIDAWVLMESIRQFDMWDNSGYGPGVIATLEVAPPEGGYQVTSLQITMVVP